MTKEALMKKGFSEDRATIAIREAEYDWRKNFFEKINQKEKWLDKNPNASPPKSPWNILKKKWSLGNHGHQCQI